MDLSASPTLALGVLSASLLGSVHCAAMCGGFACLAGGSHRLTGLAPYHGGRLLAYVVLGAVAGTVGAGLDHMGHWAGVQRAAAIATGLLLVLWGFALLGQQLDVPFLPRFVRAGTPDGAARLIGRILLPLRAQGSGVRALALGLCTGLIPCGWLYAFVFSAGGTGSAWRGAAFMGVFWLGTVPALTAVAIGARKITGPLQRRLPLVSAALVIAIGVLSLGNRLTMARAQTAGAVASYDASGTRHTTPVGPSHAH